jgi:hypothetical protein
VIITVRIVQSTLGCTGSSKAAGVGPAVERVYQALVRHAAGGGFLAEASEHACGRCPGLLRVLVGREQRPFSRVLVENSNGEAALSSPYQQRLLEIGFERSSHGLVLVRR